MDPLDDIRIDPDLDRPTPREPAGSGSSGWSMAIIIVALAVAAVAVVVWWPGRPPEAPAGAPAQAAQPVAESRSPLGPATDAIELPPLFLTDPLVRELIGQLSSHPDVAAWLAGDGLVRNVVVLIENVASGQSASRHLARLAPKTPFRAARAAGSLIIDPASYERYAAIAAGVASLNPAGLARVYSKLKPRMVEAYRDLGHPEGDLDGATERAVTLLLQTPLVEGDIPLVEKVLSFKFQRTDLEELEPAQKQLIRMGPRNQQVIQDQLRAIARELGIPEKRLPVR